MQFSQICSWSAELRRWSPAATRGLRPQYLEQASLLLGTSFASYLAAVLMSPPDLSFGALALGKVPRAVSDAVACRLWAANSLADTRLFRDRQLFHSLVARVMDRFKKAEEASRPRY